MLRRLAKKRDKNRIACVFCLSDVRFRGKATAGDELVEQVMYRASGEPHIVPREEPGTCIPVVPRLSVTARMPSAAVCLALACWRSHGCHRKKKWKTGHQRWSVRSPRRLAAGRRVPRLMLRAFSPRSRPSLTRDKNLGARSGIRLCRIVAYH